MDYIFILAIFISITLTIIFLPLWIKKSKETGLLWEDMNKYNHPRNVASSGGIVVIMAFIISVLSYIFLRTFLFEKSPYESEIFALLLMVMILAIVGLTDDLLGWKNKGLSAKTRILFALIASVPLVVINAGTSVVHLPFVGVIDFGILFPILIIPLAVGFVSTTYNFLAGFNGLEAGLGAMILTYLGFVAFVTGSPRFSIIALCMVASLLVFLYFNWTPAKVFPGDCLTYSIGALIIGIAILGNFERQAIIVFIPFLIEVVLKTRGKLKKHSFAKPNKDNSLELKYDKIYGLTHFSIWFLKKFKRKVYEQDVVYFIYSIQIVFILIAMAFLFL